MSIDIWSLCKGINYFTLLNETAWRIEADKSNSLRKLADSLEEQEILEELIESSNPIAIERDLFLHSLLSNPFKHPPLEYGSRFAKKIEPSLWYGSLKLPTAMAEVAFYYFNRLRASENDFGLVQTSFAAFSAAIQTEKGINLTSYPFHDYVTRISSPNSYEESQKLGSAMRESGVDAIKYTSARDPQGINLALFTPNAFLNKKPHASSLQSWILYTSPDKQRIEFNQTHSMTPKKFIFTVDQFFIDNELPFPAN